MYTLWRNDVIFADTHKMLIWYAYYCVLDIILVLFWYTKVHIHLHVHTCTSTRVVKPQSGIQPE